MAFICSIQWSTSHPDDIEYKGEMTLEMAIDCFQQFPWSDQLKIVAQRTNNNLTYTLPTLLFTNTKNEKLAIYTSEETGFYVSYETTTHFSEIYLSHNFTQNPEGTTVEGLIECFFDGSIESALRLSEKTMDDLQKTFVETNRFTLHSTNKIRFLQPVLVSVGLMFIILYLIVEYSVYHGTPIKNGFYLLLIPFIVSIPTIFLYLHYLLTDKNKIIEVNPNTQEVSITDNRETIRIQKKDIRECTVLFTSNRRLFWSDFQYLRIKVSDTKAFIITCLMADPEEIVGLLKINYQKHDVFFPILSGDTLTEKEVTQRKKYYEEQKQEFLERFRSYEVEKLKSIVENADQYADYALAAAKELLQKRNC